MSSNIQIFASTFHLFKNSFINCFFFPPLFSSLSQKKTKPFLDMRGWDGVKYDSDKSYDRSHVSEKFFESFVPGNVKHRSKKFPSSLFLPFIKQFQVEKRKENGNFHSKFCFFFQGIDWMFIDHGFSTRNLSRFETFWTEPISEWLMRVSRVFIDVDMLITRYLAFCSGEIKLYSTFSNS